MAPGHTLRDFWTFLRHEKKHWLAVSAVLLLLLVLLTMYAFHSGSDPFIYSLF
ncbi:MAG TPA: DUF5989 family protein [Vicinamibacterales bacterium]|nr:DUF5989 family protein [Vicinamibacterales bacterium]